MWGLGVPEDLETFRREFLKEPLNGSNL